jgi:hypothetical protein
VRKVRSYAPWSADSSLRSTRSASARRLPTLRSIDARACGPRTATTTAASEIGWDDDEPSWGPDPGPRVIQVGNASRSCPASSWSRLSRSELPALPAVDQHEDAAAPEPSPRARARRGDGRRNLFASNRPPRPAPSAGRRSGGYAAFRQVRATTKPGGESEPRRGPKQGSAHKDHY